MSTAEDTRTAIVSRSATHAREARKLLDQADRARNAAAWKGDRAADALCYAAMAQAHATLAVEATLEQIGITLSWEAPPR